MDDNTSKLSALIKRQIDATSAIERAMGGQSAISRMAKDLQRQNDVFSAAFGPLEQLRKSGQLSYIADHARQMQSLQDDLKAAAARFSIPETSHLSELLKNFEASPTAEIFRKFQEQDSALKHAMESMQSPWLDITNEMRSINAFADMQGIGHALRTMPAFGDRLSEILRFDLGDWRDQIVWPQDIFTDPLARTSFYKQQGLDSGLTAFPAEAFDETLDISGLRDAPPDRAENYDGDHASDDQEAGFVRTNAAHDRLQRFETQVRRFIDTQMKKEFGDQWVKHRLPNGMRDRWVEKRDKARENGEKDYPLIAYADFTDYQQIIVRGDNWREVFSPFFGRQTSVQESFQRLYPIRICTMHSRMVTLDDELYLVVETKRILAAIAC